MGSGQLCHARVLDNTDVAVPEQRPRWRAAQKHNVSPSRNLRAWPPSLAGLQLDRNLFCERLDRIREVRKSIMHFDPDGVEPEDLERLREFAKFMKSLRYGRAPGSDRMNLPKVKGSKAFERMTFYDIIPDIHGHSEKLEALLGQLGYVRTGRSWRHATAAGGSSFSGTLSTAEPTTRVCSAPCAS